LPNLRRLDVSRLILAIVVLMLVGCDTLTPEVPTPTPTWIFSAPTLEPTRDPLRARPTEPPLVFGGLGQNNPTAAALPADSALPPIVEGDAITPTLQQVAIPLRSGGVITAELHQNPPVEFEGQRINTRLPGILLIGERIAAWGDFPASLREAGFTVLVADMGSATFTGDFQDVFGSLMEVGTVDPGRIAVIGSRAGADLTLIGCAQEPACDAVVLISPQNAETLTNVLGNYNPRPIYIAASNDDATAYETAQAVAGVATGDVTLDLPLSAGEGTEMLNQMERLTTDITDWLSQTLVPVALDDGF
jgi:hypothetical protein